jgi:enoyl-CoA hydratase/carnithine racemase
LTDIANDKTLGVVILTGAGRAFSAGVDLKALQAAGIDISAGNVGDDLNNAARGVIETITKMPQAVIAKVNGFCFTGGVELMLAADIIIVAEEAKLGDTHAILGFRPTWGMTQRLPRAVGMMRAKELSYTARHISGLEAAEYGLALEAVPAVELDAHVADLAQKIAANSAGSIAAYKDLYAKADNSGLNDGLSYEETTNYDIEDVGSRLNTFLSRL